jgi:hypothetical protein
MLPKEGDKYRRVTKSCIWTQGEVYKITYVWDGSLEGTVRIAADRDDYGVPVFFIDRSLDWEKVD